MTTDEQLRNAFSNLQAGARQAQLRWVTADSVNKDARIMDATGVADNLPYYDIQLGMGAFNIIPKLGTNCLVAIVEGQETNAFLLAAQEAEEIEVNATECIKINGGKQNGLVLAGKLINKINELVKAFNTHTHTLMSGDVKVGGYTNLEPIIVPAIVKADQYDDMEICEIENEYITQ